MHTPIVKGKPLPSPCPAIFRGEQGASAGGMPIDFEPSIPGLLVTEPKTPLEQNLAHADWVRACAEMEASA